MKVQTQASSRTVVGTSSIIHSLSANYKT